VHTQAPLPELTAEPVSDDDLLGRCIRGERHAFGILFDRHSRTVYATAILVVRNAADAEEVVSDAFVTLWRKRENIRILDGSVLPWLITTARFEALNRRRATRQSLSLDDEIDTHRSVAADVTVAELALSQQLDAVINQLAFVDRQIVLLCLVDELSYEDAAQHLGLTHATVRNRLHRARKQLRTELRSDFERHDDDSDD
jgi:RNA polymerase sigma-70 factor (ECF subfamily)